MNAFGALGLTNFDSDCIGNSIQWASIQLTHHVFANAGQLMTKSLQDQYDRIPMMKCNEVKGTFERYLGILEVTTSIAINGSVVNCWIKLLITIEI